MREYFRMDNTEGFTEKELDTLNLMANMLLDDEDDDEKVQAVTEKILREYV